MLSATNCGFCFRGRCSDIAPRVQVIPCPNTQHPQALNNKYPICKRACILGLYSLLGVCVCLLLGGSDCQPKIRNHGPVAWGSHRIWNPYIAVKYHASNKGPYFEPMDCQTSWYLAGLQDERIDPPCRHTESKQQGLDAPAPPNYTFKTTPNTVQ